MLIKISAKSKKAHKAAAKKLKMSAEIPDFSMLPADYALYLTAVLMLTVIIEAGKNGEVNDITDHSKKKYEPWHYAEDGYKPGSSAGGFSFSRYVIDLDFSTVGARLSFNSYEDMKANTAAYPELWEIIKLNVK